MLPSGLPETVEDHETLARFLTSSSHHSATAIKPAAFLPNPADMETSVFRHPCEPWAELWAIARSEAAQGRNIHGAAVATARDVRQAGLEIIATEPPPRHAGIRGWPQHADPELQKARHKELAIVLSSKSEFLRE